MFHPNNIHCTFLFWFLVIKFFLLDRSFQTVWPKVRQKFWVHFVFCPIWNIAKICISINQKMKVCFQKSNLISIHGICIKKNCTCMNISLAICRSNCWENKKWQESLKQWWSSIPPISTKQIITSDLNWTHWALKNRPRHMMLEIYMYATSWLGTGTKMWQG